MGSVDFERCWYALKEVIASKPSHGQRDLFAAMSLIEIEGQARQREGVTPSQSDRRPATSRPREGARNGN